MRASAARLGTEAYTLSFLLILGRTIYSLRYPEPSGIFGCRN